jgi:hypothetical protein
MEPKEDQGRDLQTFSAEDRLGRALLIGSIVPYMSATGLASKLTCIGYVIVGLFCG